MYRLRNIAMRDYQKSATNGQTHRQTNRRTDSQTPDKAIPMCRYASQATQKLFICVTLTNGIRQYIKFINCISIFNHSYNTLRSNLQTYGQLC